MLPEAISTLAETDRPDIGELGEDLLDGEIGILDFFAAPYVDQMGMSGVALVFAGVSAAGVLSWSQSFTITAVWVILVGGFFMVLLPTPAAVVFAVGVTFMLAIAFYSIIWRQVGDR